MKYIIFKKQSKYPECDGQFNDWLDKRLFGKPETLREWVKCWSLYFQGLAGRETVNGLSYWSFIVKDREKFIRNKLTKNDDLIE